MRGPRLSESEAPGFGAAPQGPCPCTFRLSPLPALSCNRACGLGGLAPRTIETAYTIFASIMPHADKTVIRLLTPKQVMRLSRAMPPQHGPLVLLGAAAGLRQGEAFGLSVDRVRVPIPTPCGPYTSRDHLKLHDGDP
ncbi:hypothetical protein GCM10023074_30680 [Microbispora amethystogenes]|uniref:Tyr recombinase domain-containing protein n=1 Tax=Microbispora amethystogenes TaxID=1427754 RepID=A0ABQ4FLH9_9ACTN|nr:hypothetical protein Mam01_58120 [Microbispora amethystogenes]